MFRKFAIPFLLVMASGCSSRDLRPDDLPGSIASNYPTLEMFACGKHFHGIGECAIEEGQALSDLAISVQSYYRGKIQIDSPDCDYSNTLGYEGWQRVPVNLPGLAYQNCTIGITLAPEYPPQHDQNITVESFRGYLRIRKVPSVTKWQGSNSRMKVTGFSKITLPFSETKQVLVEGCGLSSNTALEPINGKLILDLKTLGFDSSKVRRCAVEGLVVGATPQDDYYFTWMVIVYADKYVPLPKPALTLDGKNLVVTSDDMTSVVSLDADNKIDRQGKFKFDPSLPHTVRVLTVKGRSAVVDWHPSIQQWTGVSDDE